MSVDDLVVSNAGFPTVRADINSVFAAFASMHSNTARSSGAVTGTMWLDTDTPSTNEQRINIYDGASDIVLGHVDFSNDRFIPWGAPAARAVAKSTDFTAGSTSMGLLHTCSPSTGGMTVTLLAASSAGTGFTFSFRNDADDVLTIDGNGAETIDGLTTLLLARGQSCALVSDGSNWKTVGLGNRRLLQRTTSTSAATFDLTGNAIYDDYQVKLNGVFPVTSGTSIGLQYIESGTPSTSGYTYFRVSGNGASGTVNGGNSTASATIPLATQITSSTAAGHGIFGTIEMAAAQSTAAKHVTFSVAASTAANVAGTWFGGGQRAATAGVDGFRLTTNGGGNLGGTAELWAVLR